MLWRGRPRPRFAPQGRSVGGWCVLSCSPSRSRMIGPERTIFGLRRRRPHALPPLADGLIMADLGGWPILCFCFLSAPSRCGCPTQRGFRWVSANATRGFVMACSRMIGPKRIIFSNCSADLRSRPPTLRKTRKGWAPPLAPERQGFVPHVSQCEASIAACCCCTVRLCHCSVAL